MSYHSREAGSAARNSLSTSLPIDGIGDDDDDTVVMGLVKTLFTKMHGLEQEVKRLRPALDEEVRSIRNTIEENSNEMKSRLIQLETRFRDLSEKVESVSASRLQHLDESSGNQQTSVDIFDKELRAQGAALKSLTMKYEQDLSSYGTELTKLSISQESLEVNVQELLENAYTKDKPALTFQAHVPDKGSSMAQRMATDRAQLSASPMEGCREQNTLDVGVNAPADCTQDEVRGRRDSQHNSSSRLSVASPTMESQQDHGGILSDLNISSWTLFRQCHTDYGSQPHILVQIFYTSLRKNWRAFVANISEPDDSGQASLPGNRMKRSFFERLITTKQYGLDIEESRLTVSQSVYNVCSLSVRFLPSLVDYVKAYRRMVFVLLPDDDMTNDVEIVRRNYEGTNDANLAYRHCLSATGSPSIQLLHHEQQPLVMLRGSLTARIKEQHRQNSHCRDYAAHGPTAHRDTSRQSREAPSDHRDAAHDSDRPTKERRLQ